MNRLFFWSLTAALAGFLFGFDTIVISGAEKKIQSLWELGDFQHGLAMSMALWGTVIGSLVGGWPTDMYGRKSTLLGIGILYFASAVWSALANDVNSFMVARFIGGIGVGISTVAAPLYISEISPPEYRGRLAGMFQFNIVFGILIALVSNYLLGGLGETAWRWMLGVEAIPALIYSVMCFGLPQSPRWLISRKNDLSKATEVMQLLQPDVSASEIEQSVNEIVVALSTASTASLEASSTPASRSSIDSTENPYRTPPTRSVESSSSSFWGGMKKPILLAFLIAFFNQLSGINAVLYFAPRIFEMTGLGEQAALLQSVGIGLTNLLFTFVGLWLIDRLGRKTLLIIGSFGYIASLGFCAWAFFTENFGIVPACIFSFIAAHAIGQGAVIWVFISEIFPDRHRANGQAFGCFTHWIFAALLTLFFPKMVKLFEPGYVFGFFCLMMVLQLFWVLTMVPETKGRSLEQIQSDIGVA